MLPWKDAASEIDACSAPNAREHTHTHTHTAQHATRTLHSVRAAAFQTTTTSTPRPQQPTINHERVYHRFYTIIRGIDIVLRAAARG
jgi:hypothetical protein